MRTRAWVLTVFNLVQGVRVVVNIYGVHQNPELWPEPLKVRVHAVALYSWKTSSDIVAAERRILAFDLNF